MSPSLQTSRSRDPAEEARLETLASYGLVGTPREPEFQHVVELAAELFRVPIALVSLVERDIQFFKACVGLDVCATSIEVSLCGHAIRQDGVMVIPDARQDPRSRDHALVTGAPHIRFYAGAPLVSASGHKLGTLCLIDRRARHDFTPAKVARLASLARIVMDRMELRRVERSREAGHERFCKMTATSPDAIVCADAGGLINVWNATAERLFGYAAAEAIGRSLNLIVPERFRAMHNAGLRRAAEEGGASLVGRMIEVVALHRDGSEFPAELSLSMWREERGPGFGAIMRDISERRRNEARLHQLAHYCTVTNLPNRVLFGQRLATGLAGGAALSLLDIDDFKDVNDSLGHPVGDALLRAAADRLVERVGEAGLVSRLGGDEFAILLEGGDPLRAAGMADGIVDAFLAPFEAGGHTIYVTASMGIALSCADGCGPEALMANADLALYRAKADGRRKVRLFEAGMRTQVEARLKLEEELRRAHERGEFELHYQPQVLLSREASLGHGRIVGAEALLRWRHPESGLLAPGCFLSVLEAGSLAADVGAWAIRAACDQAAAWRAAGLPPVRMGVNLFADQFRRDVDLAGIVTDALERTGLPPGALELEITENIALRHDAAMLVPLRRLRALGVGIAFDDFDTGYASLSMLKRFPLTRLKIDRSFVSDLQTDEDDAAIVKAVIALGRSLELEVIAEGIEEPGQQAFLAAFGCHEGQGYLYGRPMPAAAFGALLLAESLAESPIAAAA